MTSKESAHVETVGTPAKRPRTRAGGKTVPEETAVRASSTMLASPEMSLPLRTSPPALLAKRRKAGSLFDGSQSSSKGRGSSILDGPGAVVSPSSKKDPSDGRSKQQEQWRPRADKSQFYSPTSKVEVTFRADRFTPQRNLGSLFTSPLPEASKTSPEEPCVPAKDPRRLPTIDAEPGGKSCAVYGRNA